jgi:hypothetical protein
MIKRLVLTLAVVLLATSMYAGGKSCEMKSGKSVELNGTLLGGDHPTFRTADGGKTYNVCEKTKESVLKLGNDGKSTLHVKGKIVTCGEGEELLIDTANKI